MGGKLFNGRKISGKSDKIKVENKIFDFLHTIPYKFVGSWYAKTENNDVDVAVEQPIREFLDKSGLEYVYIPGIDQYSIKFPIDDEFVQLDIMQVVNFGWADFAYHYEPTSQYSSRERNRLLQDFLTKRTKRLIDENTYTKYVIRQTTGLFKITKTIKPNKIISAEFISSNPNDVVKLLNIPEFPNSVETILKYYESD